MLLINILLIQHVGKFMIRKITFLLSLLLCIHSLDASEHETPYATTPINLSVNPRLQELPVSPLNDGMQNSPNTQRPNYGTLIINRLIALQSQVTTCSILVASQTQDPLPALEALNTSLQSLFGRLGESITEQQNMHEILKAQSAVIAKQTEHLTLVTQALLQIDTKLKEHQEYEKKQLEQLNQQAQSSSSHQTATSSPSQQTLDAEAVPLNDSSQKIDELKQGILNCQNTISLNCLNIARLYSEDPQTHESACRYLESYNRAAKQSSDPTAQKIYDETLAKLVTQGRAKRQRSTQI